LLMCLTKCCIEYMFVSFYLFPIPMKEITK